MPATANWTATHKYARVLRNHRTVFGFWFARDDSGSEFAVTLFGFTAYLWRA